MRQRAADADADATSKMEKGDAGGGGVTPPTTAAGRLLGLDECLEAGVALDEELRRGVRGVAANTRTADESGSAAILDTEGKRRAALSQLVLGSHVALRLCSAADDEQLAWSLSDKADAPTRWARAIAILTAKRDQLHAMQSMLAAFPSSGDDESFS